MIFGAAGLYAGRGVNAGGDFVLDCDFLAAGLICFTPELSHQQHSPFPVGKVTQSGCQGTQRHKPGAQLHPLETPAFIRHSCATAGDFSATPVSPVFPRSFSASGGTLVTASIEAEVANTTASSAPALLSTKSFIVGSRWRSSAMAPGRLSPRGAHGFSRLVCA
jgi:hypothetical protein